MHGERLELVCPACGSGRTFEFLRRARVPVHQNLLLADAAAARAVRRGTLALRLCRACGFGYNAAFDPALLDYGASYDNTQTCSPAFDAYLDELVQHLVEARGVRDCHVVEVGCGKGDFLRRLASWPGANVRGLGFDPSYRGPDEEVPGGRLRFRRTIFEPLAGDERADAVVSRHVIEHLPDPQVFLAAVRRATHNSARARLFLETPCLAWILRNQVHWDVFYEHCSLFTVASLATTLARAGFATSSVRHVFGGQYLWAEAPAGDERATPAPDEPARLAEQAAAFMATERCQVAAWRECLCLWRTRGPVAVWGAGAKGVTFCNLADPAGEAIACVIDVNPAKQGQYVAGTGHRILGPTALPAECIRTVLVLNPNYAREIAAEVARLNPTTVVMDLMATEAREIRKSA